MGVPVNGKHAIEVAAFVAVFQRPFSTRSIEALSGLQETLKDSLPSFQRTNIIELRLDEAGAQPSHSVGPVSGVFLQRLRTDGRQSWTLKAEGNVVIVQCFEYETWATTSPEALVYLQSALNVVADEENPLAVVSLQIIDRFVEKTRNTYSIGQVFNKRSQFLTKHAIQAGPLWHVYQGWFEQTAVEGLGRLLNVLNLSTNDTPSGLVTTIDHNAQLQSEGVPIAYFSDPNWLKQAFNELHFKNKTVVGDLLNAKQRKAVKL